MNKERDSKTGTASHTPPATKNQPKQNILTMLDIVSSTRGLGGYTLCKLLAPTSNGLVAVLLLALVSSGWCQSQELSKTKGLAEQDNVEAQRALGDAYLDGEGVTQDYREAMRWFRKAADQGDMKAQTAVGWMYKNGTGVARDDREAVRWYRMAAENGDALSQDILGNSYLRGEGVEKDGGEAVRWFTMAAKQGHAGAQVDLGSCYEDGIGVQRDPVEANRWYFRAAQQGDATGQVALGTSYENGLGVQTNLVEAYKWYGLAASQKENAKMSEAARSYLADVTRLMSAEKLLRRSTWSQCLCGA